MRLITLDLVFEDWEVEALERLADEAGESVADTAHSLLRADLAEYEEERLS